MLNGAGAEGLGRMAALGGHETPLAESLREINPSASFVRICQNFARRGLFPMPAAAGGRGFAARGQEGSRGGLLRALRGVRVRGGRVRGGVGCRIERIGSGFDFVAVENAIAIGIRVMEIR